MGNKQKKVVQQADWKDSLKTIAKENFDMDVKYDESKIDTEKNVSMKLYMDHISPIESNKGAKAPYNFIPLNDKVVFSDFNSAISTFDKYYQSNLTGYIQLKIETKTPMYIRGTKSDSPGFFAPVNGKLRIPGSSLRGLTRNMVEITSNGKFLQFEDRRLFFRGLADISNLRYDYQSRMVNVNDNYFPMVQAGILQKLGHNNYVIYPSRMDNHNNQIYRINFDSQSRIVANSGDTPLILAEYQFKEVYFQQTEAKEHTHYRSQFKGGKKEKRYKLKYALLQGMRIHKSDQFPSKGYIISSGKFQNKHMHWVINEPDLKNPIRINIGVINEYIKDDNRNSFSLIKELNQKQEIPCFYITNQAGDIISFGHTGMFRLAYQNTVKNHIPDQLSNSYSSSDISESIFGNEKKFAGRIFFEEAFAESNANMTLGENHPKILSEPKPTTFQHYLIQNSSNVKELKHYNPDSTGKLSSIRGYKQYWHKTGRNWITTADEVNKYPTQHTKINPVKAGVIFSGRIRFENLSEVELGALLFALDLPPDCAHKIGMGKPRGLGSIRITPTLHLSDRKKRYSELFSEWSETLTESKEENKTIIYFKDRFADYVLKQLKGNSQNYIAQDLWEEDRMKQLFAMLDFMSKPDDTETRYLELKEFKNRPVLPKPTDVQKNKRG